MRFVLHYRGPLRSNGTPRHKHELRQAFHRQLAELWRHEPLNRAPYLLKPRDSTLKYERPSSLRPLAPFTFVPLLTEELLVTAELSVAMLRPEPPGRLITQGGDIDNRLKTLFDSLTMPRHVNALPIDVSVAPDEAPFYCLLEDDNLITSVSVTTEQLLETPIDSSEVDVTIRVRPRTITNLTSNWMFT